MTMLFELLLNNFLFFVDPLLKYDEDGYPIEEDEYDEYGELIEEGLDDLDDLYDEDLVPPVEDELLDDE